jgi:hypothetical protein
MSVRTAALVAAALLAGADRPNPAAVRDERSLEQRARRALDDAEKSLQAARKSYEAGNWPGTADSLAALRESVELVLTSLKQTGKRPRKSPREFTRAEIKTRNLQRKLEDFLLKMSVEEREQVEAVRASVQRVHERILKGVLEGDW